MEKKLHRIPEQAVLGGVASGLAQYMQIDVVIIRVLFVVLLLLPIPPNFFWTGLIYIILWAVLPTGPAIAYENSNPTFNFGSGDPTSDKKRSEQTVMILGGALVLFGILMLVDHLPIWYHVREYFWPVALIALGAFLILRQRDKEQENKYSANTGTTPPPTSPDPTPANPVDPDPQPYTPFTTDTTSHHFPEDPESPKAGDSDDDVIKVN